MPEPSRAPRVLLDENVDRLLKSHFDSTVDVATVPEQGWTGLSDGELLRRADRRFDVLVTMDQNLPHQQNLPVVRTRRGDAEGKQRLSGRGGADAGGKRRDSRGRGGRGDGCGRITPIAADDGPMPFSKNGRRSEP